MSEIRKTSIFALAISVPVTAICWFFTWTLVHSQDVTQHIASILLAPALGLFFTWSRFGFSESPQLLIPLAFLAQFFGYFLVIYMIRLLFRTVRGARA